jgi:PAS domain-containing protein
MDQALLFGAILFAILSSLVLLVFYLWFNLKKYRQTIRKERDEATRHLYELAILKELGERTGYSLNIEEILQVITGSLRQFIDYTAVGYMVISPEKLKLHTQIETPVSNLFLQKMKAKMLASLEALTAKSFERVELEEITSGAIVVDEIKKDIGSIFNIPIVINGVVAGVLSVAHTSLGLYNEADMTILYKIIGQASEAVSRLQEVVKMEKGKLNAMVLSMGDGVLMVDGEYRVVVANPAIKKIINFDKNSDKEVTIFDFVDALGGKFDIHGRLEEALVNKKSFVSERINFDEKVFEIGVYPVLHTDNKGGNQMLGGVVVFHDVSKDVELERVREEFTSMIVHELRSPLDGMTVTAR